MRFRRIQNVVDAIPCMRILEVAFVDPMLLPPWVVEAIRGRCILPRRDKALVASPTETVEAKPSDWIVQTPEGSLFVYDRHTFSLNYEPTGDTA